MTKPTIYEINGVSKPFQHWCAEAGMKPLTVYQRMKRLGISFEDALGKGHRYKRVVRGTYEHDGRIQTLSDWCREFGVNLPMVSRRLKKGWSLCDALSIKERTSHEPLIAKRRAEGFIGRTFGRLTVVEGAGTKGEGDDRARVWRCICACGANAIASTNSLTSGHTKSCGCLQAERQAAGNVTHGKSDDPIYIVWLNMVSRCSNPGSSSYQNYGGRGIQVCERWKVFENFYADMGNPPKGRSLERLDNEGGYNADNCCWATKHRQSRNKRSNVFVTIDGRTKVLYDWLREYGITAGGVANRMKNGWTIEEAIVTPKAARFR